MATPMAEVTATAHNDGRLHALAPRRHPANDIGSVAYPDSELEPGSETNSDSGRTPPWKARRVHSPSIKGTKPSGTTKLEHRPSADARTLLPSPKRPRQFLGSSGRLGYMQAPCEKLRLRLEISRTPIVDLLLGPARQFGFPERRAIVARLVQKLRLRKQSGLASGRKWHENLELRLAVEGQRTKIKRLRIAVEGKGGLTAKLMTSFGIVPYDPQLCREHLEKQLLPLVVANKECFPTLKSCRCIIESNRGPSTVVPVDS